MPCPERMGCDICRDVKEQGNHGVAAILAQNRVKPRGMSRSRELARPTARDQTSWTCTDHCLHLACGAVLFHAGTWCPTVGQAVPACQPTEAECYYEPENLWSISGLQDIRPGALRHRLLNNPAIVGKLFREGRKGLHQLLLGLARQGVRKRLPPCARVQTWSADGQPTTTTSSAETGQIGGEGRRPPPPSGER